MLFGHAWDPSWRPSGVLWGSLGPFGLTFWLLLAPLELPYDSLLALFGVFYSSRPASFWLYFGTLGIHGYPGSLESLGPRALGGPWGFQIPGLFGSLGSRVGRPWVPGP